MPVSYFSLYEDSLHQEPSNVVIIGSHAAVLAMQPNAVIPAQHLEVIRQLSKNISVTNESGSSASTYFSGLLLEKLQKVSICILPTGGSRHNAPGRPHAVCDLLMTNKGSGNVTVLLLNDDPDATSFSTAAAVARAFPAYALKKKASVEPVVHVYMNHSSQPDANQRGAVRYSVAEKLAKNIRMCQTLVDMPPNILTTDHYVQQIIENVVTPLNESNAVVTCKVIRGEELRELGLNGLYGVGQASECPPSLVILSYVPPSSDSAKSLCLVGKGIVYDTGGLSIKTKEGMPGMKTDMGGSAGVLMGFMSAIETQKHEDAKSPFSRPVHALLCISENSVGPKATRPDDVHVMYSGKTVEINNTDAEGRLVLSDGCAYAVRHLNPEFIIDMATLTGAQGIATGKKHAGIYCSDESLESLCILHGKYSGDLVHPLPYCPEFFAPEFKSAIADMKNSVADRANAQASCAGQFIGNHISEWIGEGGKWLHIDMAYPSHKGDRATGYGVALLYSLIKSICV